jgi:NAD(P)-dependent dehydrogenase (short-subunit alcohol dehydrogenase family)
VTGANSGLGKAVAIQLAQRGARVIMACRSGFDEAGEDVKKRSASADVEMEYVDLADLNSVNALCDRLRDAGTVLDVVVLNAGLMPLNARRSAQGYELMFAVHFLANRLLLERLFQDGVIQYVQKAESPPRIIFVASEAHQSSEPINFDRLGEFVEFGLKDGMKHYASSKLNMLTYAKELSRRLSPSDTIAVAVHSLCPGPIASNIARESPAYIKPILAPIMKLFFRTPEKAAEPVIYLCCTKEMGERTSAYFHMMREKAPSPLACDAENGRMQWEKSHALLEDFL